MVKVRVIKNNENYGLLCIYYSQKKKKYTLVTSEICTEEIQRYMKMLWDNMNDEALRYRGKYVIKVKRNSQ